MGKNLELNMIYNMDCIEGLKHLKDDSVDLIIADFPYNISDYGNAITKVGSEFKKADFGEWDKFGFEDYCKWVIEIFKEFERVLKPKHQVYAWFDNHFAGHYTFLIETQTGMQQKCPIVCYKRNPIPQLRKKNFRSSFDMCVLYTKDPDKKCEPFNFLTQAKMKNVQEYNLDKRTKHPTEKNLGLVERFVRISSNKGDLVVDPFMGSGTTAVACNKLQRDFIGFEMNKEFVEMATKRVKPHLEQEGLSRWN